MTCAKVQAMAFSHVKMISASYEFRELLLSLS